MSTNGLEHIILEMRSHNQLFGSEGQLRAILSGLNAGVSVSAVTDGRLKYIYANDSFFSIYGYTREQFASEISYPLQLVFPEDRAAAERAILDFIGTRSPAVHEYRCVKRDGSIVHMRLSVSPVGLAGIPDTVCMAEHTDITQQVRDAERILSLNADYENIINDIPGGYCRLRIHEDGSLSTEYVNDSMCKMRGLSREQLLSVSGDDLILSVHPADADALRAVIGEMIATGETRSATYSLLNADGDYIRVQVNGRMTTGEHGERYLNAYYADITEREQKERSYHETLSSMLSSMMHASTDLSFVKDVSFRYICGSRAFANMVGLEDELSLSGKTDYDLFDKDLAEQYRADDRKLIEGGESLIDYMEQIPSVDGLPRYSVTSKYLLYDSYGNVIGIYGTGRDVTETRTAFEQLKLLTDSIPGGLLTYATSGGALKVTYFNDGICRMLGCTREEYKEATDKGIITSVFEEDIPYLKKHIAAMITEGTPIDCTYRLHNMNNDGFKWVNLRVAPPEKLGSERFANAVLYDVTEQKAAAEAAFIHQRELDSALSQMGRIISEYDVATRTLTLPETYAEKYGLPRVCENVPECFKDTGRMTDEMYTLYAGLYAAILRGEKTGVAEIQKMDENGAAHWDRMEFVTVFGENGRPVKALIAADDTTEQHNRYELEKNRPTLGEGNLIVHALFDLNTGETLDYAYADGREVPPEERTVFLTDPHSLNFHIVNEDDRRRYRELNDPAKLLSRFAEGETELCMDYRRRMTDGSVIWVRNLLHMMQEPGGSDVLLFEYCYNINDEKLIESMYAAIVNENFDYVARVDIRTGRFSVVRNNDVLYGMPPGNGEDFDAVTSDIADRFIHPDDKDATAYNMSLEGIRKNLSGTSRFRYIFRLILPNGTIRHKKLTMYYLDRDTDSVIITREDVTQVLREEAEKSAALADALTAAKQASLAKSTFLSRMSHELRTPMNAIIGLSALSASELDDPKAMENNIGKIGISARYLLSLINDILEMSRIESGRMTLSEDPFDFEQFISEVNTIIYSQAEAHGLDYDVIVRSYTEPTYVGDATKLQEILVNVLGNAVKFTPSGGKVTLAIEQLRRVKDRAVLRFTVSDTGIGMDEEFLPHLFDPFSQESASYTSTSTGTGLGLAITKTLTEMMNGQIQVKSIKDVGSVFTIDLQLGISDESRHYLDLVASMNLDSLRALVVDDDVTVCTSTEKMLKAMGMKAEWADSGSAAIDRVETAHAEKKDFDTIFIDWKMPDMDGIETTRRIRRIVGPDITIIIMTAYDWLSIEAEAYEAGVDMFMEKPLFQSSVIKAFERVFFTHREKIEPVPEKKPDLAGRRILIAEDHPLNIEVARRLLEKAGAETVIANNGLEALETFTTAEDGYFDAILMDIRMPEMDGLTAAKSIRKLRKKYSRDIPIIAMTANAFDDDVELSLKSGMNAHLTKPIEPKLLYSTLDRLIKQSRI